MAIEARNRVPSAAANGKNGHSLISDAKFRQLYELALKLQMAGDAREWRWARAIWLRGREAVLAGVAADLREDDGLVAGSIASIAGDFRCADCAVRGRTRRSFEERVIEALSDAVADRMRKTGRVSVIFFDAARRAERFCRRRARWRSRRSCRCCLSKTDPKRKPSGQLGVTQKEAAGGDRISDDSGGHAGCDCDVSSGARVDCAGAGGQRPDAHCGRAMAVDRQSGRTGCASERRSRSTIWSSG